MLLQAGLAGVDVRGGYSDAQPTADTDFLVLVATK
jgi:hypothetical protein